MLAGDERTSLRDYVAFMECHSSKPWLDTFRSQLQAWLSSKRLEADIAQSVDVDLGQTRMSVRRIQNGPTDEMHFTLVEQQPKVGTFTTELYAHQGNNGDSWIDFSVRNDQGRFVNVPRLVRELARTLPLRDGALAFADEPRLLGVDDVDDLVDLLADDRRHGLAFVVRTPLAYTDDMTPFARKVGIWSKETAGLAQVIVLDPEATGLFRRRLGEDFDAPDWAIQGFHPGARFDDPADSRRHRYVTLPRLAAMDDAQIQILLGDIARRQTIDRAASPAETEVRRRFERDENQRLLGRVRVPDTPVDQPDTEKSSPPKGVRPPISVTPEQQTDGVEQRSGTATDDARLREQMGIVQRVLGIPRITEQAIRDFLARVRGNAVANDVAALESRIDQLQDALEKAEDQNRELDAALKEADYELDFARLKEVETAGRMKWLEARLKSHDDYEHTYASVPDEYLVSPPNNFDELLERIEQLPTVEFTGDRTECIKLDMQSNADTALRWAWDAVLVLSDYARAREEGACQHGLDHYIKHPPAGFFTITASRFAETETARTMQQHGASRMFPVPPSVDSAGRVAMKAHFKLDRRGLYPRMHIHDGHPTSPRVFIGYIGPHLPIASH